MKNKIWAKVKNNMKAGEDVYMLELEGKFKGGSGQFYMINTGMNGGLPRPISIHHIDDKGIKFLYMKKGKGTEKLSTVRTGDEVEIFGPLGNGMDMEEINQNYKNIALVSGGIGIAPMRQIAEDIKGKKIDLFCGFRDVDYSVENVEKNVNKIIISTETGKTGLKGYITDHIDVENYDLIITCGPNIMMKKIVEHCRKKEVQCIVLMENYMACGVGACLGCTCETVWGRKRVCADGPAFKGEELIVDEM